MTPKQSTGTVSAEWSVDKDAEYIAAWNTLQVLRGRRADVEKRINAMFTPSPVRKDPIGEAAAALLENPDHKVPLPLLDVELQRGRAALYNEQMVLMRAITMQEQVVQEIEARASRRICEQARPEYTAIVRDKTKALLHLVRLAVKEQQFREALLDAGVHFASFLPPMVIHGVGQLNDSSSYVNQWLKEAFELGYLDRHWLKSELGEDFLRWSKEVVGFLNNQPQEVERAKTSRVSHEEGDDAWTRST